jgi:tRNA A22 N-methylase
MKRRKDVMKYVTDARIKRGFEICSDHYLLTIELVTECQREKKKTKSGNWHWHLALKKI